MRSYKGGKANDARLELPYAVQGIRFASPVGLSPELSADGKGLKALSGFGSLVYG